jgi:nucleotide-binding universal stress UspA family protein
MTPTLERPATTQKSGLRSFEAVLVHAEPERASAHRVEVAARLARETGAHLIGVGAEALDAAVASDPYSGIIMAEYVVAATEEIERRLKSAEQAFRRDAAGADIEWRIAHTFPNDALIQLSRTADLVVAGAIAKGASNYRTVSPSGVILSAGRPMLIVPDDGRHLRAQSIVVAWKETREARRAVIDALPLLQRAEDVIVQAVSDRDDLEAGAYQTNDVVAALKRHGVEARPSVTKARPEEVTQELERVADLNGADLIVAGAYGHSRLTEWAFGGVTDDLLHNPRRFVLLSH